MTGAAGRGRRTLLARGIALGLPAMAAATAGAQESSSLAAAVFASHAGQVVKVQVVETGSAAKAVIGSGFYATARGHVITNYHVIAKLVAHPERYRAEVIDRGGRTWAVRLLDVDVVSDLAVLATDARPADPLLLSTAPLRQGVRLYALGHPLDLGLSIVEGTYNGFLEHTLYPKIHFTGALNPGMSGGPTIDRDGRVIGINVSTEGNEVSFLVPAGRARALMDRALQARYQPPEKFLPVISRQILAYQQEYLGRLFADSVPRVALGHYLLPTRPAAFFKCWADADRDEDDPYEETRHRCSTDDYVFISGDQSTGVVEVHHTLLHSAELNPFRFYALFEQRFRSERSGSYGTEEDLTRFTCDARNVRQGSLVVRAAFCVRRYRKLDGLYDAVLTAATLGDAASGVVTTLTLTGVSYGNAQRIATRYLRSIAWSE